MRLLSVEADGEHGGAGSGGCGGYNQHTKDEYLVIPEMLDCFRVVEAALKAL